MYKLFLRPLLFLLDPERAHHLVFSMLKGIFKIPFTGTLAKSCFKFESRPVTLFGITFPNRIGLAAGFDKDARLYEELSCFGFGFIEIGTLTPEPQQGNPKPRMFRLPLDKGLINRMGFNNEGLNAACHRLKNKKPGLIVGGNIGKNKNTPNDQAFSDYEKGFEALFDLVDYFAVNVSSPNTPGLRELQEKEPLMRLLSRLSELNNRKKNPKPILLKIAPDLSNHQLDEIIEIVKETGIAGLIAGNTTLSREGLKTAKATVEAMGAGGLSGKPLAERATEVIRYISQKSGKTFPIIGAGGIHSPEDALEKIRAGADLVQIYTGFIYEGPGLVRRIGRRIYKEGC